MPAQLRQDRARAMKGCAYRPVPRSLRPQAGT